MYRQAQGLFRSMVGDSTLADVGRMLASWDGPESLGEALACDADEPLDAADDAVERAAADDRGGLSKALKALAESSSARGRWVFEQRLGEGGMGVVDRVWDRNLGREAARKTVVLPEGRDPQARLKLFLEEIRVISKLEHPAILPIYEAGLDEQRRVYFVMKLVRGRTLHDVFAELHAGVSRAGVERWTLNRVLGHLVSVSQALAYAHSRSVLHRDVKPANVMVGRYGETYLLDWGLARLVGDDDTPTRSRGWLGTPSYMAPERVTGPEQPEDPREDVYSLGAMLYHALAGCAPFVDQLERRDALELRGLVERGTPTPVAQLAPDAPDDLIALCEASMARERSRRPSSAEEFGEALQKYLADVSEDRVEARRQAARAQRTFDFLLDMIGQADPYVAQGRETTVREVLERAAREAGSRLSDEPEDAALMLTTLAELLLTLGRPRLAAPLLDQAGELLAELGDTRPSEQLRVLHEQARCAFKLGDLGRSEELYRELLRRSTQALGADTELTLKALYGLVGVMRTDFSRKDEAIELSRDLWERRCRVSGPEHLESLAAAVRLAGELRGVGRLDEGEQVLQQNVALLVERHGKLHMYTLLGMTELANYLDSAGRLERARDIYAECSERYAKVVGPQSVQGFISLANGAWLEHRLGATERAEEMLRRAVRGLRDSGDTDTLGTLAAEHNLGLLWLHLGRVDDACAQLADVVRRAEKGPASMRAALGRFRSNWGRALLAAGQLDLARTQLHDALAALRASVGPEHDWTRDAEAWSDQTSASEPPPRDA